MTQEKKYIETPLMKQYYSIKNTHPDAILLFRVGDFYETFGDDAIKASEILGITLTRRANGSCSYVELAGFPYHAIDTYLPKLVRAGERVAICEQLEDPKTTKKIVKRGVTELVTPGITFNDNILSHKENTYVACVYFGKKNVGVSFLDVTTGEFYTAEGTPEYAEKLLTNFRPKEVLYQRGCKDQFISVFGNKYYLYHLEQWIFSEKNAIEKLKTQCEVSSLKGFGIESMTSGIIAAGAILYYLEFTEHHQTKHISHITRIEEDKYVWLDKYTLRNLEIFAPAAPGGKSLIDVIDRTASPMGSRMLKRWISLPLKDKKQIDSRLNITQYLIEHKEIATSFYNELSAIGDIERLISKVAIGRVNPREVVQLKNAFAAIQKIKTICASSDNTLLQKWGNSLDPCSTIKQRIETTLLEEPANMIQKGGVIAKGVSAELDSLRSLSVNSKEYLHSIQARESERTGISSLKISFNNVFGYYIEVRNTHKDKVPADWTRKQTLSGAERYITAELKEYEEKILGAEEKILSLEAEIYGALVIELSSYTQAVQSNATIIAQIDTLLSFAQTAEEHSYCRPVVTEENVLDIRQGRHPVIESLMSIGDKYIPNDVYLDDKEQQIIIITGPNMSGKSALLRQTGLIVLLAQIGCYVPAQSAHIGIVDKIFTRVGASDNISQGESTFMVEMLESANILNNITNRSLVLLDEIGRGTSTYDGISIAWAMVEYLHEHSSGGARTLFATHYHELNEMAEIYSRIKNYNVQVKEINNKVIFLRKLIPGGTEHSFGIHVARMAGMPRIVVARAQEILQLLEERHRSSGEEKIGVTHTSKTDAAKFPEFKNTIETSNGTQLSLFQLDDPLIYQLRDQIKNIDINNITPLEALNKISEIKKLLGI